MRRNRFLFKIVVYVMLAAIVLSTLIFTLESLI
jgi:hypothetical protein